MNIVVVDTQTIGSTDAQIFEMLQTGVVQALITLKNNGTNVMSYRVQQNVSGTWTDMATLPDPLNNTLSAGQLVAVNVAASYPQVRLMGSSSGGTQLEFAVLRYFNRADGGAIPILSL